MSKNCIVLFADAEKLGKREDFELRLDRQVDVALTAVCDILKLNKSDIIHKLVRDYVNDRFMEMDVETLATYSRRKNTDDDAQQLARLIAMMKLTDPSYSLEKEDEVNE